MTSKTWLKLVVISVVLNIIILFVLAVIYFKTSYVYAAIYELDLNMIKYVEEY